MPIYLKITSADGQVFTGSCEVKNHVGEIEVISWSQDFQYVKVELDDDLDDMINEASSAVDKIAHLRIQDAEALQADMAEMKRLKTQFFQSGGQNSRAFVHQLSRWQQRTAQKAATLERREQQRQTRLKQIAVLPKISQAIDLGDETQPAKLAVTQRLWKALAARGEQALDNLQNIQQVLNETLQESLDSGLSEASTHDPFLFEKTLDAASPRLFEACCRGEKLRSCVFKMYRPLSLDKTGTQALTQAENCYLTVTLSNALISSYGISGSEELPNESVAINYSKAEFCFISGDVSTGGPNSPKTIALDWAAGEALLK